MKQILQNLKTGHTDIIEVPAPGLGRGQVLIRTTRSLVSAGTERMVVDFGKAGWLDKARQQPEKVKQVLDKIRTDGLIPTIEAVFNKLDEPMPLGYCSAGIVIDVGPGVSDFAPGDRVASNGPHAEMVCVPRNLCAKIPDNVPDEEAAFTILVSIALQGVRLAAPTLGEKMMVFGLGLVGLLTVQLLRANGCPVMAVDVSEARLQMAKTFGAETVNLREGADAVTAATAWTNGRGADGIIIAASAKGDDIVHQAAQACRKRGRIILVGVVDLNLKRSDFYEKEITFQVSCSYGPGRYDEKYEQNGQDYPFGFVRWTEQRNFEAVLEAMKTGQLQVRELITHRISLDKAVLAYDKLLHDSGALGIIIEYPVDTAENGGIGKEEYFYSRQRVQPILPSPKGHQSFTDGATAYPCVGIIGAGNYARATLLPALKGTKVDLIAIADINGVVSAHAARKYGARQAVSDYRVLLDDPQVQAVFILVGHHLHARFICEALEAGKNVFVEKPLALNDDDLSKVAETISKTQNLQLMVGYNRRFSPHIVKIRGLLSGRSEPLCMSMTVNAGFIPPEHWTQDPQRGGGRIIGEACHFMDLLSHLADSPIVSVSAVKVGGAAVVREDKMSILMGFADGSVGTVHYFANGAKSYPKETLEIFGDGRVLKMENFRATRGYGFNGFHSFRTWRQDKGHRAEIAAFAANVASGGPPLIPFTELENISRASFAAVESAKTARIIHL